MLESNIRRKLYEYVVDEIGLRIINGRYRPGETLPNEDALCREFDVSRGVVREAMKVLVQKGLVVLRPRTGTRVRPPREWNLFDPDVLLWKYRSGEKTAFIDNIMEMRRIIEAEAAMLAATRASEREVNRIRGIYDKMEALIMEADDALWEDCILLDMNFHMAILEACGNELIAQIGHTMRHCLLTARQKDRHDFEAYREALPAHRAILNAITDRKPREAYDAARRLIDGVWREMRRPQS
jgi:DNA-binding FadR family transcriptional regulator